MKKISLTIAGCLSLCVAFCQPDSISQNKLKSFVARVRTIDNKVLKGKFLSLNDTQLVLRSYTGQQYIAPENIKSFTLRRKNSVLKGALIGLGIGAVAGIIIGYASGDDPLMAYPDPADDPFGFGSLGVALNNAFAMTAGEKAAAGGIGLGTTGAIAGTIVGALAKKKFTIGGRKQRFRDLQSEVMMKLVRR